MKPDPVVVGREQDGRRPAVVVSSDAYLAQMTNLVLVVPATTRSKPWPNRVPIQSSPPLSVQTYAMPEQVRAVARERITDVAAHVDPESLDEIDGWLRNFLDLR